MKVHVSPAVLAEVPDALAQVAAGGHKLVEPSAEVDIRVHLATEEDLPSTASLAQTADVSILVLGTAVAVADVPANVDEIAVLPLQEGELRARLAFMKRRRLRTSRRKLLQAAIESARDIIEITDPEARYQYVNKAFSDTFGIPREEVIDKTPKEVIRSDMHGPDFWREIDATLSRGEAWQGVIISQTKDGRYVHLESTLCPLYDGHGHMTHHLGVKRDVTRRVLAEEELRLANSQLAAARDEALAADTAKSQFLANMSHELRTPLNAIIGYSEILEEDARDEGLDDFIADLGKIRNAGRHLLGLINDVLDLSKIEAGKMDLYLEDFDVGPTIAAIADTVKPLFTQNQNELVVHCAPDLGEMRTDLTKLRQTLMNLLSNANKFTEKGTITLDVGSEEDFVRIDVTDSGIGMNEEQLGRLFQPFVQAESDTTRRFGGTGLGLTISRRFCEMMGGSVTVSSDLGRGSTFSVRLPRQTPDPRSGVQVLPKDTEHVVMVIDDDPAARELITRSLGALSVRVEGVTRGQDALERARDSEPDVIVLDVMMPGMDGWAVLKELKANVDTRDIPVVMHTVSHEREVGFALGAVDFIVKPEEPRRLARVIASHLKGSGPILLVEDDPDARELIRRALTNAGHEVMEASGGGEAIRIMAQATPRLVVLDLMMPGVDGFEVLEHIRSQPRLQQLPVVVVTAKSLTIDERSFLEGATRRVIEKTGYSREDLLDAVRDRVAEVIAESD